MDPSDVVPFIQHGGGRISLGSAKGCPVIDLH